MKHIIILISLLLLLSGCHTTSRLGEGEVLYTGVKKLKVEAADTIEVPSGINDNINLIINNDNSRCPGAGEERQYIPLRFSGRQLYQGFRARRVADTDES